MTPKQEGRRGESPALSRQAQDRLFGQGYVHAFKIFVAANTRVCQDQKAKNPASEILFRAWEHLRIYSASSR